VPRVWAPWGGVLNKVAELTSIMRLSLNRIDGYVYSALRSIINHDPAKSLKAKILRG